MKAAGGSGLPLQPVETGECSPTLGPTAVADQARMLGSSVGKAGLEFRELARGGERNYSCSYLVRSIQRKTALYVVCCRLTWTLT